MGCISSKDKDWNAVGNEKDSASATNTAATTNATARTVATNANSNANTKEASKLPQGRTDSWQSDGRSLQEAEDAAAQIFGNMSVSSRVSLSFKCHGLPNVDSLLSKTDSFVVAYIDKDEVGRTEIVSNNLDPVFATSIEVTYNFEENQRLKVYVFQADDRSRNDQTAKIDLKTYNLIGTARCTLSHLITAPGGKKTLIMEAVRGKPNITILAQEIYAASQTQIIRIALSGHNLDKKDFMGKSDPYYKVYRLHETEKGTEEVLTFKSEVRKQTLNPVWDRVDIKMASFGGDMSSPFRIEVFDWDMNGGHDFIGEMRTSLQALQAIQGTEKKLELINPKRKGDTKVAGSISVRELSVIIKPTFLQYISGGCEINFSVAIDFTASNGDPRDATSLHHVRPFDPRFLNPYQKCILAVGDVLQHYDDDKKYPCFGFGAVLPHRNNEKSHCFALNNNEAAPEVFGIQGILAAYNGVIPHIKLSGPTMFSEIIMTMAARTKSNNVSQQRQSYQVLLLITDGVLNDMDETINAIVTASSLGLSIIIVGVGSADFTAMEVLDGDKQRLHGTAGFVERDIVQFVPYRDFVQPDGQFDHIKFSKALLQEIPAQMVSYFESKNIKPNPPRAADEKSDISFGNNASMSFGDLLNFPLDSKESGIGMNLASGNPPFADTTRTSQGGPTVFPFSQTPPPFPPSFPAAGYTGNANTNAAATQELNAAMAQVFASFPGMFASPPMGVDPSAGSPAPGYPPQAAPFIVYSQSPAYTPDGGRTASVVSDTEFHPTQNPYYNPLNGPSAPPPGVPQASSSQYPVPNSPAYPQPVPPTIPPPSVSGAPGGPPPGY
eukprot:CAMPEP_0184696688 /NCGR_PEP_ID=MMETSP0313-20130426/3901_1 /TAXON_ID=2792 /ORGANISM="Porphyridium aerugineum, Strain SAG 1380-2" /LENGTH=834 /DNA_ID=CAMNT_0027155369 /DNA_START=87 /DNA_END=2591 /DNA_ORIENTATION=-